MTDVNGSLNQAMQTVKGEIQEMLKVASEGMGSRIEEVVESKTLSIENRLTSTDMMLRNVLAKQAKEAEDLQEKHPKRTVSDAKERAGQDQADAKVRSETAEMEGKGQDGSNDMKSWLNKQISGITGDAQVQSHNLEGAELLSWMKKHVNELVTDLLPAHPVATPSPPHEDASPSSPKDTPLSLVTPWIQPGLMMPMGLPPKISPQLLGMHHGTSHVWTSHDKSLWCRKEGAKYMHDVRVS